jgi:hypothetical protein
MRIELTVLIYVLMIGAEVGLLFTKKKFILFIPSIISSIVFLANRSGMWIIISIVDLIIAALGTCSIIVAEAFFKKKTISETERSKIEDLS